MFLSTIKEAMVRSFSKKTQNERGTVDEEADEKCNEEKPKSEVEELLEQCSNFEEMDTLDTQDYPDSPNLFPSQKSEDKEWKEEGEEDSDCYEIVDKPNTDLEKEKSRKNQPVKDRSRLSLTRKRRLSEQADQDSPALSDNKQRRVTNDENVVPNREKTESQDSQDVCLLRVYKKPICQTIEEADRSNLLYAPENVTPAAYTPVIVRKLESYQRRLRHAQSKLRSSSLPRSHFVIVDPISGKLRGRAGARNKRTNIAKKSTLEYKKWAERNRNNYTFVAALCDILASLEPRSQAAEVVHIVEPFNKFKTTTRESETQTNNNDVVCTKVSPRKTVKTVETPTRDKATARATQSADVSTTSGVAKTKVNNDLTVKNVNGDVSIETVYNEVGVEPARKDVGVETVNDDIAVKTENKNVVMETVNNKTASPVNPVLDEKHRKTILEELSSDDESQKFNFQRPVVPEETNTEQADCVLIETVTSVAKEPSPQRVPESIECPMCYKDFPAITIEQHAFHCNGPSDASTSSVRTVKVQDGQLSPVIKTRTPTKVKELKLLINAEARARAFGVENEDGRRNSTGGINVEGKKQTKRRVSLEPCIKLQHVTTGTKWGESVITGNNDTKGNGKKESTSRQKIDQTLQKKRLSSSNTRKNVAKNSWPDLTSLKKDFIPLEFEEKENEKIPSKDVHKLLSLVDTNNTESSSDEEVETKKPVPSRRKNVEVDDDMSALNAMATDYKGRKRKSNNNVQKNAKKVKVSSTDKMATEHCYICGKDMPRSQFNEHVNEELARQAKEDKEKDLSMVSSMSQNTQSDEMNVVEPAASSDSRRPLPDLAEGTTWSTNDEGGIPSLKTYTPIHDGSVYHKQFSFQEDKGQSNRNKGQRGRGQRGRGQRGRGQQGRGQRGKGRWLRKR